MVLKKKVNLLMISSTSKLGGGTKLMFSLGEKLDNKFNIFYAIPENEIFSKHLNSKNHLNISERKINLRDIINLRNFINSNSIDIIHAHGKGAGAISRIAACFLSKPLIYTFHGIHLKCHSWWKRSIYIFYEYLFGRIDSTKVLVSKSEKIYAENSKIYLGNYPIIINNGVSNMPFKNSIQLKNNEKDSHDINKIKVITVCRFVKQKNIKDTLKIANYLPNLEFLIIGDGPEWSKIKLQISEENIKNVNLLGQKNNVIEDLYSSDIYLSTSLYEGLPISILEAMSIGLPIVASNVIGNCDTIESGKSGFLYELNDINSAVCALSKLAKSKYLRESIGYQAFERQRKIFSEELMISSYVSLYKNQLN